MAFFDRLTLFRAAATPGRIQKHAQWTASGERYMRKLGGLSRTALVSVDPGIQHVVLGLMDSAAPILARSFQRRLVPVAEAAFDKWPVQTGLSKSLIGLEFTVDAFGRFKASFVNRTPYALFIRQGQTVKDLVWTPGERAADMIAQEAAKDLGTQ